MRCGELYGLTWSDVDYEGQRLLVRRSSHRGELTETTKTKVGRMVPMLPRAAEELREHHKGLIREEKIVRRCRRCVPSASSLPLMASAGFDAVERLESHGWLTV